MVDQVYDKIFWLKAEEIVLFSEPLVRVLRMVDSDKSVMGFFYEAMDQAREQIKVALKDKSTFLYGESLMKDGTNNSIDLYMQLTTI